MGFAGVKNSIAVSFGTAAADVAVRYAKVYDSAGNLWFRAAAQTDLAFAAGEEIKLPIGAIRIGLEYTP